MAIPEPGQAPRGGEGVRDLPEDRAAGPNAEQAKERRRLRDAQGVHQVGSAGPRGRHRHASPEPPGRQVPDRRGGPPRRPGPLRRSRSSPYPRPSAPITCAPPRPPGSATSARTRCRKPCRRSPKRPTCRSRWHLIGHLQSNKAKKAAGAFACIHSVDSVDLAAAAGRGRPRRRARAPEVLVQVDLAGEATKFGAAACRGPADPGRAPPARAVRLAGLMLLPPWNEDPEQTRPWFVRLRSCATRGSAEGGVPADALRHLSMGMSHDFEAAIEEGATIVRVGTAIFGTERAPSLSAIGSDGQPTEQ